MVIVRRTSSGRLQIFNVTALSENVHLKVFTYSTMDISSPLLVCHDFRCSSLIVQIKGLANDIDVEVLLAFFDSTKPRYGAKQKYD